jgi:hypothetical protein
MLGLPKGNDFVVMFGDNFLYKEVVDRYKDYFDQKNFLFQNMTDYINATVVSVNFASIKAGTTTQTKLGDTYTHRSGMNSKAKVSKVMRVTFQLKRGFLNWFILNDQLSRYIDSTSGATNKELTGNDTFLPPITIFILDDDGNIVFERIYKNIVMSEMDDLNLVKTDNKVSKKEFTVTFNYSEWNIKYNMTERVNIMDKKYVY